MAEVKVTLATGIVARTVRLAMSIAAIPLNPQM